MAEIMLASKFIIHKETSGRATVNKGMSVNFNVVMGELARYD
jgi:hypothetical protein